MSAGLLVMFEDEVGLRRALERLYPLQLLELRTYTPKPLELEPPHPTTRVAAVMAASATRVRRLSPDLASILFLLTLLVE